MEVDDFAHNVTYASDQLIMRDTVPKRDEISSEKTCDARGGLYLPCAVRILEA